MSTGWQTQCNMVMLQRCWGQHYVHTIWLYPVKAAQQVKEIHIASFARLDFRPFARMFRFARLSLKIQVQCIPMLVKKKANGSGRDTSLVALWSLNSLGVHKSSKDGTYYSQYIHFTRQQLHCYTLLQLSNNTPSGFLPPMPMQHRTLAAREKQHPAPVVHPVTLLWRVLTLWVAASRRRTSKLWNYDRHNGTSPQT